MAWLASRNKSALPVAGVAFLAGLMAVAGELAPAASGQIARVDSAPRPVTALGRLEPKDGVIRVAGPARPAVVISKLLVEEGDAVREGQPIAVLDSYALHKAEVSRLQAELWKADRELERVLKLYHDGVTSDSARDNAEIAAKVARANLEGAQAELSLSVVRSPLSGQVLKIHARTGERVGLDGIAELGQTDRMYVVAEIYETDIDRVHLNQRATITSPALREPISGTVERIGRKVGKMDVLNTDPAAKTDARVVEVDIRLDGDHDVSGLTNLQVEVAVGP
jgi:HlyD family secretion protein